MGRLTPDPRDVLIEDVLGHGRQGKKGVFIELNARRARVNFPSFLIAGAVGWSFGQHSRHIENIIAR